MPQLDRDGVKIHYEVHGKGDPHHPQPRLQRHLQDVGEAGARRSPTTTASSPGTCAATVSSDSPDDPARYSEEATVGDMAALLDVIDARTAIVGGLSLGGYMSLAFNARLPERVRALLLFDTGPGYKSDTARDGWNKNAETRAQALETQGLAALGARSREVEARVSTARPRVWRSPPAACWRSATTA